MKLNHLAGPKLHASGLFTNVKSYDHLQRQMVVYSLLCRNREDRLGEAFEVFAEFFLKRRGKKIDIKCVRGTSIDKMHKGIDFYARRMDGRKVAIQVKYRGYGTSITINDLATFHQAAEKLGIPFQDRVVFTNVDLPGAIDRARIVAYVAADKTFFKAFARSLASGPGKAPTTREAKVKSARAETSPRIDLTPPSTWELVKHVVYIAIR